MASFLRTTSFGSDYTQAAKVAAASLTTALTGTNNDLTFTAPAGAAGNSTTVRYVVAGASTALSVSVTGSAITVNVATDSGSAAVSTATQVRTAVNASTPAAALVTAANATGNDGTGVVTALSATALTGGVDRKVARGGRTISRVQAKSGGHGSLSVS